LPCIYTVMRWSGHSGTEAYLGSQLASFSQCFDTVVWVISPVAVIPKVTYNVLSAKISLCSLTLCGYDMRLMAKATYSDEPVSSVRLSVLDGLCSCHRFLAYSRERSCVHHLIYFLVKILHIL